MCARAAWSFDIRPVYRRVDTCAAEFPATTAYLVQHLRGRVRSRCPPSGRKIMVLGGGPNRIGQGIEFDYCCVHAALAMREDGFETIMVNCNPETVSTDYDTSDRLYFEPVTLEDVLAIVDVEKPDGVIVQFGGQTPLKLVEGARGGRTCPSSAPRPDAIDQRGGSGSASRSLIEKARPQATLQSHGGRSGNGAGGSKRRWASPSSFGRPTCSAGALWRSSTTKKELTRYMAEAVTCVERLARAARSVSRSCGRGGRGRGVGRRACRYRRDHAAHRAGRRPQRRLRLCAAAVYSSAEDVQNRIREQVTAMALELGVVGLMNVQLADAGQRDPGAGG